MTVISRLAPPDAERLGLIGRADELDRLDRFVTGLARRGSTGLIRGGSTGLARGGSTGLARGGSALLVVGEAGIGKSALLDEAAQRAAGRGVRILRSGGTEFEAAISLAGLHHLLHPLVSGRPSPGDPLRVALGLDPGPAPALLAVANAALDLLSRTGRDRPLLLVVDDLQWLDRMSATVLALVARRLSGTGAGLLGALRREEPGHFRVGPGDLDELVVEPLGPDASRRLASAVHPGLPAWQRARLVAEAAGNPLALVELGSALARPGAAPGTPLEERLRDLFARRIDPLPPSTRAILLRAALAGTGEFRAIGAPFELADLAPAEAGRLVAIDLDGRELTFRHPLTKRAVIHLATGAERRRAHLTLAERATDPLRRAWHLAEASIEPDETVAHLLEEASHTVLGRGDAPASLAALVRAAELSPDSQARARRLAEAALLAAETTGQLGDASELLGHARRAQPHATGSLGLAVAAGHLLLNNGVEVGAAQRLLAAAVTAHLDDPGTSDTAMAEALHALLMVTWMAGRAQLWEPFHQALGRLGERLPDSSILGGATFADPARAGPAVLDRLDEAISQLHRELDPARIVRLGIAGVYVDRVESCREALWRVVEDGRRGGAVGGALCAITSLCAGDWLAGRWDEALALAEEGLARCAAHGYQRYAWNLGGYVRPLIAAARGDQEATADADEMARVVVPTGAQVGVVLAHHVHAVAALGAGDFDAAYHHAAAITRPGTLASHVPHALWTILDLVEAAVGSGRPREARAHAEAARRAEVALLSPRLALVTAACSALTAEDDRQALSRFEQAVDDPAAQRWPFELARARLLYGQRLRRNRAVTDARRQLVAAGQAFEQLGATPWIRRVDLELQATAPRRSRSRQPHGNALTAQEREVAELAATGLSNKEIAARLALSPRTVSTHLYHAFPKLGITARAGLRDALSTVST